MTWPPLPEQHTWRFDEIMSIDQARANRLEKAGSPPDLVNAIKHALARALDCDDVRWGQEHAEKQSHDCRAVIQFHVGTELFDWFFNARTGYRAHFRSECTFGIDFNASMIDALRVCLQRQAPETIIGRHLLGQFDDGGPAVFTKGFLLESVVPDLSKIWCCSRLIGKRGGISDLLPGVAGPHILLEEGLPWAAPYRDEDAAWMEIKGAFLRASGPYQPKDPKMRAHSLNTTGEA
jgi:hypothetical protein